MTPRAQPVAHSIRVFADSFNVSVEDLVGRQDVQPLRSLRQMAMLVARHATGKPMQIIARNFDHRDHSTIVTSVESMRQRAVRSPWVTERCTEIILRVVAEVSPGVALFEVGGMPCVHCPDWLMIDAPPWKSSVESGASGTSIPAANGAISSVERIEV